MDNLRLNCVETDSLSQSYDIDEAIHLIMDAHRSDNILMAELVGECSSLLTSITPNVNGLKDQGILSRFLGSISGEKQHLISNILNDQNKAQLFIQQLFNKILEESERNQELTLRINNKLNRLYFELSNDNKEIKENVKNIRQKFVKFYNEYAKTVLDVKKIENTVDKHDRYLKSFCRLCNYNMSLEQFVCPKCGEIHQLKEDSISSSLKEKLSIISEVMSKKEFWDRKHKNDDPVIKWNDSIHRILQLLPDQIENEHHLKAPLNDFLNQCKLYLDNNGIKQPKDADYSSKSSLVTPEKPGLVARILNFFINIFSKLFNKTKSNDTTTYTTPENNVSNPIQFNILTELYDNLCQTLIQTTRRSINFYRSNIENFKNQVLLTESSFNESEIEFATCQRIYNDNCNKLSYLRHLLDARARAIALCNDNELISKQHGYLKNTLKHTFPSLHHDDVSIILAEQDSVYQMLESQFINERDGVIQRHADIESILSEARQNLEFSEENYIPIIESLYCIQYLATESERS